MSTTSPQGLTGTGSTTVKLQPGGEARSSEAPRQSPLPGETRVASIPPEPGSPRLDGKVALVTGSPRTIGHGVALALARAGADIAATGTDAEELKALARLVEAQEVRIHAIAHDMLDEKDISTALARALTSLGRIDIVVHCGGGFAFNTPYRGRHRPDLAERAQADLVALARLTEQVGQRIASLGTSSLVVITAPATIRPWPDLTARVLRRAVLELTKTLAQEWASTGLRINAITPGPIRMKSLLPIDDEQLSAGGDHSPAGPWDAIASVADVVLWLVSDAASHVTGAHIPLDRVQDVAVSKDWQLRVGNILGSDTTTRPYSTDAWRVGRTPLTVVR